MELSSTATESLLIPLETTTMLSLHCLNSSPGWCTGNLTSPKSAIPTHSAFGHGRFLFKEQQKTFHCFGGVNNPARTFFCSCSGPILHIKEKCPAWSHEKQNGRRGRVIEEGAEAPRLGRGLQSTDTLWQPTVDICDCSPTSEVQSSHLGAEAWNGLLLCIREETAKPK